MRWDDLDLLRLIYELEQIETGSLMSGFSLMERSLRGRGLTYQESDPRILASELLLARDAGFLTFDDRSWPGQQMPDPNQDPHLWLQRMRDLQLTLAGRDRARGIVKRAPHPDSDEDDERIIPGSSLEAIARAISDEYSDSQVARFLLESGIPTAYADQPWSGDRTEYVLSVLGAMEYPQADPARSSRGPSTGSRQAAAPAWVAPAGSAIPPRAEAGGAIVNAAAAPGRWWCEARRRSRIRSLTRRDARTADAGSDSLTPRRRSLASSG